MCFYWLSFQYKRIYISFLILSLILFLSQGTSFFMSWSSLMFQIHVNLILILHCLYLVFLLSLLSLMALFFQNPLLLLFLKIQSFKFIIHLMMIFLMKNQKNLLNLLLILSLLEGHLDQSNNHLTYKHITTIKSHLSLMLVLLIQVLPILYFLMFLISNSLPLTKPFVVLFHPLLSPLSTIKQFLIPNGEWPWLLR